jgi:membrane protein
VDLKGLIERLKDSLPGRLATAYGQSKSANYAAGLAFNAFLTMFPLILGLLSVIGLLVHNQALEGKLQEAIISIFPPDAHSQLTQAFKGIKRNVGLLTIISILGLIWSGTGLFGSMEFALGEVFGTGQRNLLRQRLMGLVMMVIFMTAILLAAGANGVAGSSLPLAPFSGFLLGSLIMVALLVMIYRFVPNRSFPFGQVWQGALLAGVLIEVLSLVFPIYGRLTHGFNTYGQQFALFFLLATWAVLPLSAAPTRSCLQPPPAGRPGGEGGRRRAWWERGHSTTPGGCHRSAAGRWGGRGSARTSRQEGGRGQPTGRPELVQNLGRKSKGRRSHLQGV